MFEYVTHDNCIFSSLSKSHVLCRITPATSCGGREIYKCLHCGLLQLCGCPTMMRIQYSRRLTLSRWSRSPTSATGLSKFVRASPWLNQMPCHWPQQASRLSVVLFVWGQIFCCGTQTATVSLLTDLEFSLIYNIIFLIQG